MKDLKKFLEKYPQEENGKIKYLIIGSYGIKLLLEGKVEGYKKDEHLTSREPKDIDLFLLDNDSHLKGNYDFYEFSEGYGMFDTLYFPDKNSIIENSTKVNYEGLVCLTFSPEAMIVSKTTGEVREKDKEDVDKLAKTFYDSLNSKKLLELYFRSGSLSYENEDIKNLLKKEINIEKDISEAITENFFLRYGLEAKELDDKYRCAIRLVIDYLPEPIKEEFISNMLNKRVDEVEKYGRALSIPLRKLSNRNTKRKIVSELLKKEIEETDFIMGVGGIDNIDFYSWAFRDILPYLPEEYQVRAVEKISNKEAKLTEDMFSKRELVISDYHHEIPKVLQHIPENKRIEVFEFLMDKKAPDLFRYANAFIKSLYDTSNHKKEVIVDKILSLDYSNAEKYAEDISS